MWKGTIWGREEHKKILTDIGISITHEKVNTENDIKQFEWEVELPDSLFCKLDPYWGQMIWSLKYYQ